VEEAFLSGVFDPGCPLPTIDPEALDWYFIAFFSVMSDSFVCRASLERNIQVNPRAKPRDDICNPHATPGSAARNINNGRQTRAGRSFVNHRVVDDDRGVSS
jgi:hypothetical protein